MVPDAVSVAELPIQIDDEEAVAVTVGVAPTLIVIVCTLVHPFAAVPVTVYVVVDVGVTVTVPPVIDPGIQLYVDAPVAVMEVEPPVQMVELAAVTATVGEGLTVIRRVAVAVHPFAEVPVTVYVVVVAGETVTGLPVNDPGIQL